MSQMSQTLNKFFKPPHYKLSKLDNNYLSPSHSRKNSKSRVNFTQEDIVDKLKHIEAQLKLKDKEIIRLNNINMFLQEQNTNKENIIMEQRREIIKLREKLTQSLSSSPSNSMDNSKASGGVRGSKNFDFQAFRALTIAESSQNNKMKASTYHLNPMLRNTNILSLHQDDDEILQAIASYPHNKAFLDEEKLMSFLQEGGMQSLSFVYDVFDRTRKEKTQYLQSILRAKQVLKASIQINEAGTMEEALEYIIQEGVKCLKCDRASCFVVDEPKQQLWSKVAKGVSGIIRVPINQGIVGYVATSKRVVNIHDAYKDARFNQEIDHVTNFQTKTILALPIKDQEKCLGVIEFFNKIDGQFTKDDEYTGLLLVEVCKGVLMRTKIRDEQIQTMHRIRLCLRIGSQLFQKRPSHMVDRLSIAEKFLRQMTNTDDVRIVLIEEKELLYQKNGTIQKCDPNQGIVGRCVREKLPIVVMNCYDNSDFSPQVDIQTNLAVLTIPAIENSVVKAVLQIQNMRGIHNYVSSQRLDQTDEEILDYFIQHLILLIK